LLGDLGVTLEFAVEFEFDVSELESSFKASEIPLSCSSVKKKKTKEKSQ
jgi:hypothetical protein